MKIKEYKKYMSRCLELAYLGIGSVSPNPMVGSLIVYKKRIIGEGYHQKYGENHAEVNAINSVKDKSLLKESTLFVNLEPCAHQGKTPSCALLIKELKIPKVVIGCIDTFSKVSGQGVKILKDAGCDVEIGILEKESRELNRRFFTFHEKMRPYIILKWAQTLDNFIDITRVNQNYVGPTWITNKLARISVHKLRAEEDAIFVGTNTAKKDNPNLNIRDWTGKNPIRIVLDKNLRLPSYLHLFDKSNETIVFTENEKASSKNLEYIKINYRANIINQIIDILYEKEIQSVIIEGGANFINSLVKENCWDEARLYIGKKFFHNGIKAPKISGNIVYSEKFIDSELFIFRKGL